MRNHEGFAGNPLFVEEFTHTLMEKGSIEKRNMKNLMKAEKMFKDMGMDYYINNLYLFS